MRKAQGMSMNVIVVAALALLILVILAVIFIGRVAKVQAPDTQQVCLDKCADIYHTGNRAATEIGQDRFLLDAWTIGCVDYCCTQLDCFAEVEEMKK